MQNGTGVELEPFLEAVQMALGKMQLDAIINALAEAKLRERIKELEVEKQVAKAPFSSDPSTWGNVPVDDVVTGQNRKEQT